jgi:hypothetical protein
MHFQGREDFQGSGLFPPDRLPVPPPFNQMPIVTANPGDPPSAAACQRPTAGQRLPLGRAGAALDGANISAFKRGILTVGGIGGGHDDRNTPGARGGDGGSITVENQTQGRMLFKDVDFFTGAGVEKLCYQITIPNGGVVKRYIAPSGGLGAKGALNGGHGGAGGKGGDITIKSEIDRLGRPSLFPDSVYGHNGADPNSDGRYSRTEIDQTLEFSLGSNTLLETNSTGGSGGSPGGGASGRSGLFGPKGVDGKTTIDGTVRYGGP